MDEPYEGVREMQNCILNFLNMTSNNPEQNKPEPPEPWEEEYETFVSGYQHCESEGYHFFNDQTENLKAFIRKVAQSEYERGRDAGAAEIASLLTQSHD